MTKDQSEELYLRFQEFVEGIPLDVEYDRATLDHTVVNRWYGRNGVVEEHEIVVRVPYTVQRDRSDDPSYDPHLEAAMRGTAR